MRKKNRIIPELTKLHTSIETLKLKAFIACVVHEKYEELTISGNPTAEQIQDAWLNIRSEYHVKRNDASAQMVLEETQDIAGYEAKRYRVELLVGFLKLRYDKRIADELIEEGYDYELSEETYEQDILKVLAELESEGTYYRATEGKADKATESAFLSTLMRVQKELRACPMLTPKQMTEQLTVSEYVEYLNEYDDYIKSQTAEKIEEDAGY